MPLKCFFSPPPPSPPITTTFSSWPLVFSPLSASPFIFSPLVSVEFLMDEMERRSIVEEPVRKCPIPAPRTSVSSPSASPSLRHKSE